MLPAPALALALLAAAPVELTTVAERSGWLRTGRFDEVEALCAAFPRRYPGKVRCERFGTTPLGRPLLALVASADGVLTAEDAARRQRPVVLLQGGIHAGEIDGKDAGFWLLRDLLDGAVLPGALGKLTLVFVPVFNVDGHERFGPNNRPNQRGPEAMGFRATAQGYNLNRDYLKADAPEMVAMLGLMHRFDPVLFADLHVTDGAKFQHDVSVTFEPQNVGPEALRVQGRALQVALFAALEAQGHHPVPFYPSFLRDDDPSSGFALGVAPPRFSTAYWFAHHRFGVLVETHSWKDYPTRVRTTYDVCVGLLAQAMAEGANWLRAARAADAKAATLGGEAVTLLWEADQRARPIDFLGYAYTREPSSVSGAPWVRYDENTPQVWKVPLHDELVPSLTVTLPKVGWLVPAAQAPLVAQKLKAHGLSFRAVTVGRQAVAVQTFRGEASFRPTSFEGHQLAAVRGEWAADTQDVPAGSLFVPVAQPHVEVAAHLLEPTAPDSLTAWGFFNTAFEQKEYLEAYLAEAWARELLADAGVQAEFDARLKDEAFKRDPTARLRFFAERHPSRDTRLGLVPVYRALAEP